MVTITSKQAVFNTVFLAARSQGCKSLDSSGERCRYRGDKKRKCFAGMAIPDRLYDKEMEGKFIEVVWAKFPKVSEYFNEDEDILRLLSKLQSLHDNNEVERWKAGFKMIAKKYCLTIPCSFTINHSFMLN